MVSFVLDSKMQMFAQSGSALLRRYPTFRLRGSTLEFEISEKHLTLLLGHYPAEALAVSPSAIFALYFSNG